MVSKTTFCEALQALKPAPHRWPVELDRETGKLVFILCAFLKRSKALKGPAQHSLIRKLLESGVSSEKVLRAWIESHAGRRLNEKSWDSFRAQADGWQAENIRVVQWGLLYGRSPNEDGADNESAWNSNDSSQKVADEPVCPALLFVRGILNHELPWLAVFNSRKPRSPSPDARWLDALRFALNGIGSDKVVFATSIGTLTYDMVGAYAADRNFPFVVTAPFSILEPSSEISRLYGEATHGPALLSCLIDTNGCSKERRLLCRDRHLAAVSQAHLILEIRSGGNFASVLQRQQERDPRFQVIFEPGNKTSANAGNYSLLEKFPGHSRNFRVPQRVIPAWSITAGDQDFGHVRNHSDPNRIDWQKYLFHYARGCAGPWPGESRQEYLLNLLAGEALSGHSALDTLLRILREGRIRAGTKLVRGNEAVISWTSHPPQEMFILRKWNPALVRWTVEPYGLAVGRDYLRSLGAKPAIYGPSKTYSRLPESERYRFQRSEKSGTAWRHEREWRFLGDLVLDRAGKRQGFVFVRTREEKAQVLSLVKADLPVVAFEESATIRE